MTLDRYCEVCGEVLTAVRPHARYCSPRCRQSARRSQNRNASSQVSDVQSVTPSDPGTPDTSEAPVTVSAAVGAVADAHFWPAVAVANLRAAGLEEDAAAWARYFRERGEWR